jgi:hypothetical protein
MSLRERRKIDKFGEPQPKPESPGNLSRKGEYPTVPEAWMTIQTSISKVIETHRNNSDQRTQGVVEGRVI